MDVTKFPDQPVPVYTISLNTPGLTPDKVDESVTRPVEEGVRALGSSLKITSESRTGFASVTVKTMERLGSDYKERLEQKLGDIVKQLPVQEWSISQDNLADSRIGFYLLHGTDVQTLSDVARYTVYEKLIRLPGVARVEIDDAVVRQEVEIVFRPSMLIAYGLTPSDVLEQLPGDVVAEQVGHVGKEGEQTTFQWTSQSEGPQGLGKQLISTEKGYVPLKTLADIRDLRGSKGEEVSVYRGAPAVGITLYAAEVGQVPAIREQTAHAISKLNESAAGKYAMDLFEDSAQPLAGAIWQLGWICVLAASLCAIFIGAAQKRPGPALQSLLAIFMAVGSTLGGMWLSGMPLTLSSLGPLAVFSLLFTGAGAALFHRLNRLPSYSPVPCLRESWKLMKPLLLTVVVLAACWAGLMVTDFLEAEDRIVLFDAWPVLVLGTSALVLVYGFITPVLAGTWMSDTVPVLAKRPGERKKAIGYLIVSESINLGCVCFLIRKNNLPIKRGRSSMKGYDRGFLINRWERFVKQGYLPYGITLAASLVFALLLHSFVLVDPFAKTETNDKSLSLEMVQGSSTDDAIRAAQVAEERLRGMAEVQDLYTIASQERLSFHLKLADKYRWTKSRTDLEKELDKLLRDIPGTDPFALVVSDDVKTRLEFTVKGTSLLTTRDIAQEVLVYLEKLSWRDEEGREMITDERLGTGSTGTFIDIRPKQEMLARYRVTEAEIKRQLESYLGEKSAGSVYWNERNVPVKLRFPDKWMEHPDQVKTILIRTPQGTVRLADLVDWSIGKEPPVYQREDGLYVFKVSTAVSDQGRIDSLAYVIPLNMQKKVTIPEGYSILNADELKKLNEEQADNQDWSGRILAVVGLVIVVLLASLLIVGRTRDGVFALALLPVLAGGVMLGLLMMDRPLNAMGLYGIGAAVAVMVQQALLQLDHLFEAKAKQASIWNGIQTGAKRASASHLSVFGAAAIACLPLAIGWMSGIDSFASFACALLFGTLFAAFAVIVLIPGMQHAAEWKEATEAELSLPILLRRIRIWWENEKVRRHDLKERKALEIQNRKLLRSKVQSQESGRQQELSHEDFLPLSTTTQDANRS
jgi:multidrug efflux pump subunit AcrB